MAVQGRSRESGILHWKIMSWSVQARKILGSFTIGENSKIGAGSVVLEEVPPNCTVVGVPGRIVKYEMTKRCFEVKWIKFNLPDPVLSDIQRTSEREQRASRSAHGDGTER